jgi:hypothetical protein
MSGYSDLHDNPALGPGTAIPQVPRRYKGEHRLGNGSPNQLTLQEAIGQVAINVEAPDSVAEQIPVVVRPIAEDSHAEAA